MPRYDDRYSDTRLYVGRLSSRTRSRDLDNLFSRYGRVRDVDMKHDYAFVEFSDPRDADDARHRLNGREVDGSRIIVEFAKGTPRGSREYLGKGPPPGSGRCFNCGIDGHWARDCKAGDWKNTCYRCGERGHIERNCQNSPKKLRRERSYSRSPVRSRSRRGRSRSYSRSRSPPRRGRIIGREAKRSRSYSRSPETKRVASPLAKQRSYSPTPEEDRSRSYSRSPEPKRGDSPPVKSRSYSPTPKEDPSRSYSRSPELKRGASPPAKSRRYSPTPEEDIISEGDSPPPKRGRPATEQDRSEYNEDPSRSYSRSPEPKRRASPPADRRSYSPTPEEDIIRDGDSPPKSGRLATEQDRSEYNEDARANSRSPDGYSHGAGGYRSPSEVNGYSHSPSPPDYRRSDVDDDDNDDNHRFRRE